MRQRGPTPKLSDSEVITMQVVGKFLQIDGDKNIWEYCKLNWSHFFPSIGHRSSFVKQAGNLWYWINELHKIISGELGAVSDNIHITDGFPVPVCHFKRSHFSKVFKDSAAYEFCASKDSTYFGFKGHIVINSIGVISHFSYAAANVDERDVLHENLEGIEGKVLGDKDLLRPELQELLRQKNIDFEYPLRDNMKENRSEKYLKKMKDKRRLVETVIGQLSERFNIEKVRARNSWRIGMRFMRKTLSHTIGMFMNKELGRSFLQFEGLIG